MKSCPKVELADVYYRMGRVMTADSIFKDLVEPILERIPVLEAIHAERHKGREFEVSQTIHRNVFTEFDRKLSRHLAAIRGAGFPAFTVTVRVSESRRGTGRLLGATHHLSVPHALKVIAERACGKAGKANLSIDFSAPGSAVRSAHSREIDSETIASMDAALLICETLGEAEFLEISGDFDVVIAQPPCDLKPLVAHLQNGSATLPCPAGASITPFECPIYGFAGHAGANVLAQGYLATARHGLVSTKEAAVSDFRAAAERRILDFGRLKAGLGDTLSGLSEDARITALEWSAAMRENRAAARPRPGPSIVVPHPVAEAL